MTTPLSDRCSYTPILAWVNAHRDRLPQTLAELATYPMAYRRMIIGVLPVDVRVRMWQEHLSSFLDPASPLTPEQQAFVRECREAMPTLLTQPLDRRALDLMGHRGQRVLGAEYAERVLATLGPSEPPEGLPVPPD